MVVIFAEKRDMGRKIAAALDCIRLPDGKVVKFADIEKHDKALKGLQTKQGFLDITYKGKPAKVTWGYGHLCELKHAQDYDPAYKLWSKLPVPFIPDPLQLTVSEGAEGQFRVVKKLFNSASLIINAGDPDREGEVIFAYIYQLAGCKVPYQRAWFSETTQPGIQRGFSKLKSAADMKALEMAGRARGVSDWLVGINLTAQMTLKYRGSGLLSIGRVQTPVLDMLVKRELEIQNFKSSDFWKVQGVFTSASGEYNGTHKTERFAVKADAENVLKDIAGKPGKVTDVKTSKYPKEPPFLYSLTTLQMDASEIYGLTLDDTLKSAQRLYEGGYTSYPRTDSQFLPDEMWGDVKIVFSELEKIPEYAKYLSGKPRVVKNMSRYFNSKKVSSHYAIIPTGTPPSSLTGNDKKVYDLVAKSLIRIIYPTAEANRTKVVTTVNGHDFISSGSTITALGWLEVDGKTNEKFLPPLSVGDTATGEFGVAQGKTQPPKPYNDKTIVAAMETAGKDLTDAELRKILASDEVGGIGRPATRAAIIETLLKRGYVERSKGKSIRATALGISVIDKLPCEALKSAEMTAQWEKRLTMIADNKESYDVFMRDIQKHVGDWVNEIRAINSSTPLAGTTSGSPGAAPTLPCPLCGVNVVKYNWGWGCSGYKAGCKFSFLAEIAKKKLTDKQVETLITKGKTGELKGFKGKSGKDFSACLVINGAKVEFEFSSAKKKSG